MHPPQKRDEVLKLHADGMSRNDIARTTGVGAATITRWIKEAGRSFDRTATQAATQARQVDLAERRARIRETYLQRAEELLEQMTRPCVVFNFGGKDNTYNERELDRPPVRDLKDLISAASIATTAELRIAAADTNQGDEAAKSMLIALAAAFGVTGPDDQDPDGHDGD